MRNWQEVRAALEPVWAETRRIEGNPDYDTPIFIDWLEDYDLAVFLLE